MFTTYRRVLGLPGALVFSMSGLVARLPISMVSLGIVLELFIDFSVLLVRCFVPHRMTRRCRGSSCLA